MKNRKIYLYKEVYDNLKERESHIEEGIENDPLLSNTFNKDFNRNVFKSITRFIEFLKTSEDNELEEYLNKSSEIVDESSTYQGLYSYNVENLYSMYFIQSKRLFSSLEYKVLYITKYNNKPDFKDIKKLIDECHEWKREYVLNHTQDEIAHETGYNVVLGAAGTGKTDVAMYSYINNINLDKSDSKELSFITYSSRLAKYVNDELEVLLSDMHIKTKTNVFTVSEFFEKVLANANIAIDGYNLVASSYTKGKKVTNDDALINNIVTINTFSNWINSGAKELSKKTLESLNKIIDNKSINYVYQFYRGIFKGKVINKVSENETLEYLDSIYQLGFQKTKLLISLLDDYVEYTNEPSEETFSQWYKESSHKLTNSFKQLASLSEEANLFEAFNKYYDFANPVNEAKPYIDNYLLFKREASLIEGYRGEIREDFEDEMSVLYDTFISFEKYNKDNNILSDNDLAYLVCINIDKIIESGIYQNIIIDEFQDMTEREIHALIRLNYNEDTHGVIHMFGDFEQTINPTFIQYENIETLFMLNGIEDYKKQMLSSTYRYSSSLCKELEALRQKGKELFGLEDLSNYVPLTSNKTYQFETNGNLVLDDGISCSMLEEITSAKKDNIMYVVANKEEKQQFINKYKVKEDSVYTVFEAKGMEEEFVVVYHIATTNSDVFEHIFSNNVSYSRASRVFYNQLYVGITRCKTNFIQIEDSNKLGVNTIDALKELILPLKKENVNLFLEEMLSDKINYYFRALESFRSLDFEGAKENLTFYTGLDHYNLKDILKGIDLYNESRDDSKLILYANKLKNLDRLDLVRIIYIVIDKQELIKIIDLKEKNSLLSDSEISNIIKNYNKYLDNIDINEFEKQGYFERKKKALEDKINSLKIEVIR